MFSSNSHRSIFCDETFWIVVVIAIIILWVHYSCKGYGNVLGVSNGCADGCNDYCC